MHSVNLAYNGFPFPSISDTQKKEVEENVYKVLEERERHSERTLANFTTQIKCQMVCVKRITNLTLQLDAVTIVNLLKRMKNVWSVYSSLP